MTFSDSIQTPSLEGIRVQGYAVEHALFIEESDTLIFVPGYKDLTLPGSARIQAIDTVSGQIHLVTPPGWIPTLGMILADTSHGGLLLRVKAFSGQPQGVTYRDWLVSTEPARLSEALMEGSISFTGHMDWGATFPEKRWVEGISEEGINEGATGEEVDVRVSQVRMDFRPEVSGKIVAKEGKITLAQIKIQGRAVLQGEIEAFAGELGQYNFSYERLHPEKIRIPLGHGLTLDVGQGGRWNVALSTSSAEFKAGELGHCR
jgi:hypothetical protein